MRIVRRRTERCSKDGGRLGLEPGEEDEDAPSDGWNVDEKVIVYSGMQGPCWARMGAGVPSCETCTPSYARCDDSSPDEDEYEDRGGDLAHMSALRYRADEDATVEGWVVSVSWNAEADAFLEAADARSCALRSTPSTILERDGWLA